MEFGILGPLAVWKDGRELRLGAAKQRALLAVLLLHANEPVPTARVVDALWGERPPSTAVKAAQVYVSQLRKALGDGVIETQPTGYVLRIEAGALDSDRFESLLERGRTLLAGGLTEEAVGVFRSALALWRGSALADFEYEPFARGEIGRLEELRLVALELRLDADLTVGRHAEAVPELESLVHDYPVRENLRRLLMLALYRSGRQADALAVMQNARATLRDELGLDPSQALQQLEKAILRQDSSLDLAFVEPAAGLASVARQRLAKVAPVDLLERDGALATLAKARDSAALGNGRVVLVTGEPGIGKTSLVTRFVTGLEPEARVLFGTCDDLSIPRPLGPIQDMVGAVSAPLEEALTASAPSRELPSLLIAELELRPQPTVLVLEDVHWADAATLDAITVLGRRIGSLPTLVVLTFRGGEVSPGHPLRAAVGAIRAEDSVVIELAPLSEAAVASLAGDASDEVYAATGGNPFYVTELLGSRPSAELPSSVANAVLGRASRLNDDALRLVQLVSVVPNRVATSVLDAIMPGWAEAAEEPERRQLLEVDHWYVRFRHELARNAIRSSIPVAARRRLHAEILTALLSADADPADIVHHAEAAGAEEIVAEYALIAARRAAVLESTREAYSHYRRASDFIDRLPEPEQAVLLEELASAAYAVNLPEEAFAASERAIAIFVELGDAAAVGRCTRVLSRFYWSAGDGAAARRSAVDAIAILEPLGESVELARAYSALSQLAMLAEEAEQALQWGNQALELATRLGDESTRAHALVNIGTASLQLDPAQTGVLLDAHAIADRARNRHEATRALHNLGYSSMQWANPGLATQYLQHALAYAEEHEVHIFASYLPTTLAWLRLRAGEWNDAERVARSEIENGVVAETVLAELAVRRGDPDAPERLADLAADAGRTHEPQRITPALELATEWALTTGASMPIEWFLQLDDEFRARGALSGVSGIRLAAWAGVAGIEITYNGRVSAPFSAMLRRDWLGAADAFGDVGWTYDRALMLSLLDEQQSLAEAIEIARRLGAKPLTKRVASRMRELGMIVSHAANVESRENPAY